MWKVVKCIELAQVTFQGDGDGPTGSKIFGACIIYRLLRERSVSGNEKLRICSLREGLQLTCQPFFQHPHMKPGVLKIRLPLSMGVFITFVLFYIPCRSSLYKGECYVNIKSLRLHTYCR